MIIFLISFFVSLLSVWILIRVFNRSRMMDLPNERSSHHIPTPRGGGIGILLGLAVGLGMAEATISVHLPWSLYIGSLLVAVTGFFDDRIRLSAGFRFLCQFVAAALVVWQLSGLDRLPFPEPFLFDLGVWSIPLSLFWILAVTNIFNFLDGIDGLAGVQAFLVGLGLVLIGGLFSFVEFGYAMMGASLGFLIWNWHPAKIFMGDVGSSTLGFLFSALPFTKPVGSRGYFLFIIFLFLWFFLCDGIFTLFRRFLRRERFWTAHRSHLYQRLTQTGLPHDVVTSVIGSASFAFIVLTSLYVRAEMLTHNWAVPLFGLFLFGSYYLMVRLREGLVDRI